MEMGCKDLRDCGGGRRSAVVLSTSAIQRVVSPGASGGLCPTAQDRDCRVPANTPSLHRNRFVHVVAQLAGLVGLYGVFLALTRLHGGSQAPNEFPGSPGYPPGSCTRRSTRLSPRRFRRASTARSEMAAVLGHVAVGCEGVSALWCPMRPALGDTAAVSGNPETPSRALRGHSLGYGLPIVHGCLCCLAATPATPEAWFDRSSMTPLAEPACGHGVRLAVVHDSDGDRSCCPYVLDKHR